jgi:hypothetical protein
MKPVLDVADTTAMGHWSAIDMPLTGKYSDLLEVQPGTHESFEKWTYDNNDDDNCLIVKIPEGSRGAYYLSAMMRTNGFLSSGTNLSFFSDNVLSRMLLCNASGARNGAYYNHVNTSVGDCSQVFFTVNDNAPGEIRLDNPVWTGGGTTHRTADFFIMRIPEELVFDKFMPAEIKEVNHEVADLKKQVEALALLIRSTGLKAGRVDFDALEQKDEGAARPGKNLTLDDDSAKSSRIPILVRQPSTDAEDDEGSLIVKSPIPKKASSQKK